MPASLRERGLADGPVERGAVAFEAACRERSLALEPAGSGLGVLGPWRLWASRAGAEDLKRAALYVEEGFWLGQLLDIDVASAEGPLGRSALCLPPRPCVVCGGPAAACAGRAAHAPSEVEAAFLALAERARASSVPGSPAGSAVGDSRAMKIEEIETQGGDTP